MSDDPQVTETASVQGWWRLSTVAALVGAAGCVAAEGYVAWSAWQALNTSVEENPEGMAATFSSVFAAMLLPVALGALLAAVLIVRRRRSGLWWLIVVGTIIGTMALQALVGTLITRLAPMGPGTPGVAATPMTWLIVTLCVVLLTAIALVVVPAITLRRLGRPQPSH